MFALGATFLYEVSKETMTMIAGPGDPAFPPISIMAESFVIVIAICFWFTVHFTRNLRSKNEIPAQPRLDDFS